MNVKMRQLVEKEIVTAVVKQALAAGFALSVNNGGDEMEIEDVMDESAVLAAMFATDEDLLYFSKEGKDLGWVLFVYGNGGWDVISDYTLSVEPHLTEAEKVSEKYAA